MDDKQMQELNALEQAAFNDPVNFLNQEHNPRKWTLSSEDIARSYSITPAQLLHTEDELNPRKWNVAETLAREFGTGAINMFESAAEGIANSKLQKVIYRSNNMSKEDADRLVEDVLRSQVISRNRQNLEHARRVHDVWSAGIANGIGSVASMALVGAATKSPIAVGALTGIGEAYNVRNEMIDRYTEEKGTTEGVAGKLPEYNALSAAYGAIAGAIEGSIGVERLAAGSLNRYGKLAAMERLARQQGKYGKALAYKTGREFVATGAEEAGEEFLQSISEDVAIALVQDMWEDPDLKKALTQGMFGAIVGAPAGAIFYNGSRKRIIDYINKWNEDKKAGLTESQVVQMTDEILGNGAHTMVDDITTRVEIKEHFGKAYDLVKQRLTEQIDATGTTPWTDQNKSKEEYIQTLADSITIPAINVANILHIPLSDFLEIADINTATIAGNIAWLRPITSIADIDTIIANQDAIIKEQTEAKKLGVDNETVLQRARQRKAIAQRVRKDLAIENGIRTQRSNRKKENADYITAKDLQPEQVQTLENATQAQPGQEYVLFAGKRIPVEYQVVELATIQPSHIDGTPNPAYTNTELQNRASRGTTQDVADLREKATNITPERLMRASTSAEGAPVVNAQGQVIAGNGRTEIIRYAYQNPESAEKYKQELVKQGFNIDGMQQPILVRRNTTMTDQEQVAAADISNISETSAFDEASQARRDVQYLKDSPTPTDFAAKLPMSERRGLMQNNGRWNKRKVQQRYESALLAWLCGNDTQLFENLVLDRVLTQKVIDVLTANGSLVYETATKYPELQIREDIYHALIKMQRATRDNFLEVTQQLELDGRDVMPENILVWNWLFADPTTNRQYLSNYATTLANNHENANAGQDMFGQQVAPLSKKDAIMQALKKTDEAKAELSASRGREYQPLFDENGMATDPNLVAAIASYQNQFAPVPTDNKLSQEVLQQFDLAKENARLDDIYPAYDGEKIDINGKQRTVYNSTGERIAKSAEALRNFYKWFGDSKVVDEQGRPLVVYHGTDAKFDTFAKSEAGIYFTIDRTYAESEGSRIISTYMKINKPFEALYDEETITFDEMKAQGYDGMFITDMGYYIAFEPNQIKSTDNRGTYSSDTGNIYFQETEDVSVRPETARINYLESNLAEWQEFLDNTIANNTNNWNAEILEDNKKRAKKAISNIKKEIKELQESLKEPIEEKLYATHNMSLAGIKGALKLGGLAMPSLAIRKVSQGNINQFGDIVFVGGTKLVEPSKTTEVYDRDAWTPSLAYNMRYELNDKGKKFINDIASKHKSDHSPSVFLYNIEENIDTPKSNSMAMQLYCLDKGIDYDSISHYELSNSLDYLTWYEENITGNSDPYLWAENADNTDMKKYKYTLDNMMRILKRQEKSGGGFIGDTVLTTQHLLQFMANKYKNLQEIKANKNKLVSREEQTNAISEIDEAFYQLADELKLDGKNYEHYENRTGLAIAAINNENEIKANLDRYNLDSSDESVEKVKQFTQKMKDVVTDYFEVKPRRIVDFNEFSGVIVPNGAEYDDVASKLENAGVFVQRVEKGNESEYQDALMEIQRRYKTILFQKRGVIRGQYDPELPAILLTKYWNETTLVHEYHHRFLEKLFNYFKQAQTGERAVPDAFMTDMQQLFNILDIDPTQDQLTVVQQEKFATMVEAYLTGLGVDHPENLAFQSFLHWIPEQYQSILNLGYLDEQGNIVNPVLDEQTIAWFNKWFANPFMPSLATAPEIQHLTNPTDTNGEIIPSSQKVMNNREKDWGQDSEEQNKADAQLWRAINENTPNDMRAALDGEKERMKAESNNQPDDTKLPEEHKPTMREKWFKTYQPSARERAAQMAREYLTKNPEHARELAFADPETSTEFDAPVDRAMLIRAVMETVPHGSDEWYILNDNLATVKSMSGSTLSLAGDESHRAYLDAKREVEDARELKAAVNYAGTRRGALEKWNSDIKAFIAKRTAQIVATEPNSIERKTAIKAFLEEAKTKFSANTTNAVLNQMDLTGMQTKNSQVFIKWAEKQIKQATHAKIDTAEQKELMKASIAAQLALKDIDSTAQTDGKFTRAVQSAKDIRHWQFVKDKMKKAYIGRWGKWGIFTENLFGGYVPSAMLMSVNTLFFANVPSTAINTGTIRLAAKAIGKNNVDKQIQKDEIERIRQVFNASGVNLAQMDKPTSPSTLHGEKYMNTEQKHWYNFTFEILGRTDNVFRIPTFVDALARIATKNADGDKAKATALFKAYAQLNNKDESAKTARKQALAVANMAVFTQDGTLSTALNHIRSILNTLSRAPLGLDPNGFGLGNVLAPFLKTGANITEMGLSATLALPRTAIMGLKKLQGKQIPDLDKIAIRADWMNLAWTAVMVALLCALSGDDDDWYTEPYQSGRKYDPNKPYDSIRFGNTWVKLDVFGPVAIPLRTAAMTIKDWEKRKLASIGDGMFEALSDTPLVQQFTDSSLDYMNRQPGAYWSGFAYNQANKFVPAQAKTLAKAISRKTGAKLDTTGAGKTIDRKFHRNYGFDSAELTTNDLINLFTNRLKYNPQ